VKQIRFYAINKRPNRKRGLAFLFKNRKSFGGQIKARQDAQRLHARRHEHILVISLRDEFVQKKQRFYHREDTKTQRKNLVSSCLGG
jgi:hypothetical protein